jgi:hypothetical protein
LRGAFGMVVDACVTVSVAVPTRIVPVRVLPVVFVVTVNVNQPDPASSVFVVIQLSVVVDTHVHDDVVVTKAVLEPPTGCIVRDVGFSAKLQLLADCVTVNVRPAMVTVPVLCDPVSLRSTRRATGPLPVPLTPPVIETHDTLLAAVHSHWSSCSSAKSRTCNSPPPDSR